VNRHKLYLAQKSKAEAAPVVLPRVTMNRNTNSNWFCTNPLCTFILWHYLFTL